MSGGEGGKDVGGVTSPILKVGMPFTVKMEFRTFQRCPVRINQTERTRRWGRVGESESESEWEGPRWYHGGVAICRSSNA